MRLVRFVCSLAALGALAGCSSVQTIRVENASAKPLLVWRASTIANTIAIEKIPPGQAVKFGVAESRDLEILWPVVVFHMGRSQGSSELNLNHTRYALPEAYQQELESWQDRSWMGKQVTSRAGKLVYHAKRRVTLEHRGRVWHLLPKPD